MLVMRKVEVEGIEAIAATMEGWATIAKGAVNHQSVIKN